MGAGREVRRKTQIQHQRAGLINEEWGDCFMNLLANEPEKRYRLTG